MGHGHHHNHDHNCNHDHDHGHDHEHDHDHSHTVNLGTAFQIGIILNLAFTAIEFFYGWYSHSLALMADAGHNLSDVLSLIIGLIATILMKKNATARFTFGLKGSSIISALFNSLLLFVAVGAISIEAIHRFSNPEIIQTNIMMTVAGIGILINFITAMFFHSHSHSDLNAKGAFLHLMGDAAISLGVVIAGLIIKYTGANIIDPIISLIISLVIAIGTWNLFKEALSLSINAVPEKINMQALATYLKSLKEVHEVKDLHVWAISTKEIALTAHLIIPSGYPGDEFIYDIEKELKDKFSITHSTIQIETKELLRPELENCYKI